MLPYHLKTNQIYFWPFIPESSSLFPSLLAWPKSVPLHILAHSSKNGKAFVPNLSSKKEVWTCGSRANESRTRPLHICGPYIKDSLSGLFQRFYSQSLSFANFPVRKIEQQKMSATQTMNVVCRWVLFG